MKFPIIILCGGLGTRIKNYMKDTPKSLIKINNKPFLEHQLKLLKKNKFEDLYLCIGHKGEQIIDFLNSKNNFKLNINYSSDGKYKLGTGGALKKVLSKINTDFFFVTYGDSYLLENYKNIENIFIKKKFNNAICIYKNFNKLDKSNIKIHNNKIISYNKNHTDAAFIDYGLSIIKKKDYLNFSHKINNFDLNDYFKYLINTSDLNYIRVYKRFYEIGSYDGIKSLEKKLN